jgi:hypothetical protein
LARIRLEALSDSPLDANAAVCWPCGEPADPDCACTKVLNACAPVVRGYRQDAVRVRIPRCEAWTVWVGGVPLLLGIFLYERLSGRRSIDAYPPLRRLRQAGWTDPN